MSNTNDPRPQSSEVGERQTGKDENPIQRAPKPETPLDTMDKHIEMAHQKVSDLCNGRIYWRMSIPAQREEDPDMVIGRALREASALVGRLRASEAALAELRASRDNHLAAWVKTRGYQDRAEAKLYEAEASVESLLGSPILHTIEERIVGLVGSLEAARAEATKAERERCAKVAEDYPARAIYADTGGIAKAAKTLIAEAIRALPRPDTRLMRMAEEEAKQDITILHIPDSLCKICGHYMGEFNQHGWDQGDGPGRCIYCNVCHPGRKAPSSPPPPSEEPCGSCHHPPHAARACLALTEHWTPDRRYSMNLPCYCAIPSPEPTREEPSK